jgi:hypothetical protein
MTQVSAFGAHGNGQAGPAASAAFGGAFTAGMAFEVTGSGQFLYGYYLWRADSAQSATAGFALWLVTAASAGTYLGSSTAASGSGLAAGAWNLTTLAAPFALTPGTPYKAVYGLAGNFPDTSSGTGSFTGSYSAGIVNGPLTVYSPPTSLGGTNPVPFANSFQGTFGTAGSDPTADYPVSTDGSGANFWIDVLVGPSATAAAASQPLPVAMRTELVAGRGSVRVIRR